MEAIDSVRPEENVFICAGYLLHEIYVELKYEDSKAMKNRQCT
jgi:hypothetical protein